MLAISRRQIRDIPTFKRPAVRLAEHRERAVLEQNQIALAADLHEVVDRLREAVAFHNLGSAVSPGRFAVDRST